MTGAGSKLNGKVAVVTGGFQGLGRGIAEAFAAEGADIAIVDQFSESQAAPVVAALRRFGGRPLYVRADIADEQQVRAMVETALAAFDRIDVLVNNAGAHGQHTFADLPVSEWDRVMDVNLRGTFLCTRYVLPHMLRRGSGRIINMASQLGQLGGIEMVHYSASKGAVIAFTKALAREVTSRGVLVNVMAPGPIMTSVMDLETEDWKARKLAQLPIGRFGEVHEVSPTAVFLAGDDATYYVGQTLGPNGGDVML
jgi:3-oxoacyl-[acyl-carrier protein] reductase